MTADAYLRECLDILMRLVEAAQAGDREAVEFVRGCFLPFCIELCASDWQPASEARH